MNLEDEAESQCSIIQAGTVLRSPGDCHPEQRNCSAKRNSFEVEGSYRRDVSSEQGSFDCIFIRAGGGKLRPAWKM